MKIYFSEASLEDIETFGDEGTFQVQGLLQDPRYFYNGVEHGTNAGGLEEVRIFDGCNRSIPISVDTIPALIAALNECYQNYNILKEAEQVQEVLEASDSTLYTENEEGHPYVEAAF